MIFAPAPSGLIIAAPRSGAGKTTVALGLMRALALRGARVQPFKCGPDYIDPAYHAAATGRESFNLDGWAMTAPYIRHLAVECSRGSDVAIVEGVMGLFDGAAKEGREGRGATADIAALTGWPVILVLDVSGQTETAAAVALGCARYREDITIAGVILNRVASPRHAALITPAFEQMGMRVFGTLPRDETISLPERHLGLIQAAEHAELTAHLDRLGEAIAPSVDLDAIVAAARPLTAGAEPPGAAVCARVRPRPPGQRIALAQDQAFSFIYPHLLREWRQAGAEIMTFSPLADEPPDMTADAVWLPGGYPELHAGSLAAATNFIGGIRALAARGTSIHGECGGCMMLGEGLEDAAGERHAMAGLLTLETSFNRRQLHLGYRHARLLVTCALGASGAEMLGHEFHYATTLSNRDEPLLSSLDLATDQIKDVGARRGSVTGTFFHVIQMRDSG